MPDREGKIVKVKGHFGFRSLDGTYQTEWAALWPIAIQFAGKWWVEGHILGEVFRENGGRQRTICEGMPARVKE